MDYKEKLKDIINSNKTPFVDIDTFLKYFPELKESENERIRKWIIHDIQQALDDSIYNGKSIDEAKSAIAWLEKQGNRVVDEELSKMLNKVICRFINDPNIPYSERDEVSKKIVPYVEHLEKQCEQKQLKDYSTLEITDVVRQALQECESFSNIRPDLYAARVGATVESLIKKQGEQKTYDYKDLGELVIKLEETIGTSPHSREVIKEFFQKAISKYTQNYMNCLQIANGKIGELVEENYYLKEKQDEQNPAWTEKDEHWRQKAIDFMKHPDLIKATPTLAKDAINWLKSLKPQKQWKPSDEQIYSLDRVLRFYGKGTAIYDSVKDLIEQLMKLREE